jgi:RHS repeat-associated protein
VLNEYSFDAWGRRRNFSNWGYTVAAQTDLLPARGFTAHEWLPWFNLYNMNGRLYDPVVGRFLSPDNYVQMPDFSQNFNRYSYALNNPLVYTDPTGEKWRWGNPFYHFDRLAQKFMDWVNKKLEPVSDAMVEAGIPDFGVGVSVNGNGNVNVSCSYRGREVFNTKNIDRSRADQKVSEKLDEVRQAYWQDLHNASFSNLFPQKGDQVLSPLNGVWDYSLYYLFGRSYGMYSVNAEGKIIGSQPITGMAPTPGFAKGTKIIQYGGHTLSKSTLSTLNISKEHGKYAIESLKKANRLPANFHGNIGSDGSYWSKTWEYIDNVLHYLY